MTRADIRIHLRQLRVNHCEPRIDAFDIPSSCGASWRSKSIGSLRRLDLSPSLIRRERIDLSRKLVGPWPEILLVHRGVLIDHEGHDARIAVFGGEDEQRETADHLAVDQIIVGTAGRIRRLGA